MNSASSAESDFLETLEMVKKVRFADAYLFRYSPRPGTKAVTLPGMVPPEVQQERFDPFLQLRFHRSFGALVDMQKIKYLFNIHNTKTNCMLLPIIPNNLACV